MIRLIVSLVVLFPLAASAQSGVILFDRAVRYEFELPERMGAMRDQIPTASFSLMILFFDASGSLMTPAPPEEQKEEAEPQPGSGRRAMGMVQRLRMGSPSRSDQEELLEVYVNNEDGSVVEAREFMSRTFLIGGSRPAFEWKLSGEQSVFLGYTVQKATAVQDSSVIEAWFTPEIPVSAGPGLFGGLPGMIISVSVDSGHTIYSAKEVNLTGVGEGVIIAPDDGEEVSREEYEEIVAEKLEELRMRMRGRRRRP